MTIDFSQFHSITTIPNHKPHNRQLTGTQLHTTQKSIAYSIIDIPPSRLPKGAGFCSGRSWDHLLLSTLESIPQKDEIEDKIPIYLSQIKKQSQKTLSGMKGTPVHCYSTHAHPSITGKIRREIVAPFAPPPHPPSPTSLRY